MTATTENLPVLYTDNYFYALARPFGVGPLGDEVEMKQIPLGNQKPQPPRRLAMTVLHALLESGDAAFVDEGLLRAAMRRLARRQAESDAAGATPKPLERAAIERFLRLLKSGDIRPAAALLDPGDALEVL
jgi:hypothetical protein